MNGPHPGQGPQTWTFRVGDAFPPDDPVARFIAVVALGLNDNILSHTQLIAADEAYEQLYFFHLASGHLFGLAEELSRAHDEWPEIQAFVAALDRQYRNDFQAILALSEPGNATGERLRAIRNRFFHYPSLRRSTAERGRLPLARALRDNADTDGEVRVAGGALAGGIRAVFADDALVALMMQGISDENIAALLGGLGDLQAAYNRFAQAALGRYLRNLGPGVVRQQGD